MGTVSEPIDLPRPSRRGRLLRIGAALAVLLALAGYLVVQYVSGGPGAPRCVAGSGDATFRMSPEQAENAATISAVGIAHGMPERAVTIALATALQESGLRNLNHGDRDSLGLFQQRPSQGWGTAEQIMDPVYSAGKFYKHLAEVPGYSRLPLTVAAQKVQRSGFPQAYAKHEPDAAVLTASLTGRESASLTCTVAKNAQPGDPAQVRAGLTKAFGEGVVPAEQPPGAGHEIAVPVRVTEGTAAAGTDREQRGWALAHWAVARASTLHIAQVSYAGRVWSADDSAKGWSKAPASAAVPASTGRGPGAGSASDGTQEVRITLAP
ncbi:hypothetical protein DT019_23770 [Streptomyces sp. SDr-06]|uniref:hypothetical protein n=1 Tax=Streptomyces sp. SDr-06 TaxID=2267702 RepID=UPI000DEB4FAD|nr:hypothetical protein [Streptomyces sp. SDr-06]RCH66266.1 hypothetical protein DT019_23770 [Streptomyces sp. SDr-06]